MLLILGTFRLPPEKLDTARPAMHSMMAASRAEPDCIDYGYAEDVLDRGLIHVKEIWTDQAALHRHFATPHIIAWRATWGELGIGNRALKMYELGEAKAT